MWFPKQSVVAPVDFSEMSLEALRTAIQLVAEPEHLHVLHVLPAMEPGDPEALWKTPDDESRSHHAEKALREKLAEENLEGVTVAVGFGDAGQEIADYAERIDAELIVLSSHGRTGLTRLLIGSVAERVVRLAHCPVLVLRK